MLGIRGTAAAVYTHQLLTKFHVFSLNTKQVCNNIGHKIQIEKIPQKRLQNKIT
jgi:hypothetical protein